MFIYFSSLHVSGIMYPSSGKKLLHLCNTGICHSVWVVPDLLVGLQSNQQIRHHPCRVTNTSVAVFLLMMGTRMPSSLCYGCSMPMCSCHTNSCFASSLMFTVTPNTLVCAEACFLCFMQINQQTVQFVEVLL